MVLDLINAQKHFVNAQKHLKQMVKTLHGEDYKIMYKDDKRVTEEWMDSVEDLQEIDGEHFIYK